MNHLLFCNELYEMVCDPDETDLDIHIPIVILSQDAGSSLEEMLSNNSSVSVQLYSPRRPTVDIAEIFLWLMAVGTVLCASCWSAWSAREAVEHCNLLEYNNLEFLGYYLGELRLLDYGCIKFLPSLVVAAVIFLAKFTLDPKQHPWDLTMQEYSGYTPSELEKCVRLLHDLQLGKKGGNLVAIRDIYKIYKPPKHTSNFIERFILASLKETSRGGSPSSIPFACIEAGTNYSLPNLALRSGGTPSPQAMRLRRRRSISITPEIGDEIVRRGEEHSFILKPTTSMMKSPKMPSNNRISQLSLSKSGKQQPSIQLTLKSVEDKKALSPPDQYVVLVSCRRNYTKSRLFFKKASNWKPEPRQTL